MPRLSGLPPPAVAFTPPEDESQIKRAWHRFKCQMGTSSVTDSLDPTTESAGSEHGTLTRGNSYGGLDGAHSEKEAEDMDEVEQIVVENVLQLDEWRFAAMNGRGGATGSQGGTHPAGDGGVRPALSKSDETSMLSKSVGAYHVVSAELSGPGDGVQLSTGGLEQPQTDDAGSSLLPGVFRYPSDSPFPKTLDNLELGYYTTKQCGNRDFLTTFYWATAFPFLAMFAMGQKRIMNAFGSAVFVTLCAVFIIPEHETFTRNVINYSVFQAFVLWVHYMREANDRRIFTLRGELKIQYLAKQRAQINERKIMDAKKKFSNFIMHEVRVPLNTAQLAVQNLKADNAFERPEFAVEYAALDGSLQTCTQVLNDVLDFSRMERGGFSSVSQPFSFHRVMRASMGALMLDAEARGLELETSFDLSIDEVACRLAQTAPGEKQGAAEHPVEEGRGVVIGDELRLRQVINNLASNACKFTEPGGRISITTKLLHPVLSGLSQSAPPVMSRPHAKSLDSTLSGTTLYLQNKADVESQAERNSSLVVRIEVTDTGVGICRKDLADNRLFSAYVQTSAAQMYGGKGTGLGLSLVRQIVTLSGGRLGVKSKPNCGSTFWVEMPYGIAPPSCSNLSSAGDCSQGRGNQGDELPTPSSYLSSRSEYSFGLPRRNSTMTPGLVSIDDRMLHSVQERSEESDTSPSPVPPPLMRRNSRRQSITGTSAATSTLSSPALVPFATPALYSMASPPLSSPTVVPGTPASASSIFTLPSPSIASTSPTSRELHFLRGPLRVIIIDDDMLTRKLMSRLLERLGCRVSTAENGQLGLDAILKKGDDVESEPDNFDVIFLDNQMPVCTGLEAVQHLRKLGRDDFVVGITANAQPESISEYLDAGATRLLTKPVREASLKEVLHVADQLREGRLGLADAGSMV